MDNNHLVSLTAKHSSLDHLIVEEARRPRPDAALLSRLKKEKLKIKEALASH